MTIVKNMNPLYANNIALKVVKLLISYRPFWETLKERNMTAYTLITKYNISSATIDRIKKGNGITTTKIDDFCRILNCEVSDIIEYIPDDK